MTPEDGGTTDRGFVSIDGEEYVPRGALDDVRAERDRLVAEVERLREALAALQDRDE